MQRKVHSQIRHGQVAIIVMDPMITLAMIIQVAMMSISNKRGRIILNILK
jgi:hypothetical protein